MANNKILGNSGEDIASSYLEAEGYCLLSRNYRCRIGEIDIVAQQGDIIAFVEVKTRTSDKFGAPSEAVGKGKQGRIVRTALNFLQYHNMFDCMSRFDVLEVIYDEDLEEYSVNHITDAFQYSGKYGY